MKTINALVVLSILIFNACMTEARIISLPEQTARLRQSEELLTRAVLLMRSGGRSELAEARACLELAQELSPHDARIPDGLGSVSWREGSMERAGYWFRRAIELDPDYDRPYVHLALLAEREGDMAAARELLLLAIELDPRDAHARNNYAAFLLDHLGRDPRSRAKAHIELLKSSQLTADKRDPIIEHNLSLSAGTPAR